MSVVKTLILVAALYWVGKMVVDSVKAARSGELVLHVSPAWLALSALIVLATNALLIWAWLYIVRGLSGGSIRFLHGARIWFISNLGTLIPGKVWAIIQMGAMSVDAGINPVAAGAASIINTAVNIATGMAIGAITSAPLIASYLHQPEWFAWLVAGGALIGVLALPAIVPWGFRFLDQWGIRVPKAETKPGIIAVAALANVVSWFGYGAAFLCLDRALVAPTAQSLVQHTAAFTTSYVIGYLVLVAPGGIGVREAALTWFLKASGMSTAAQATALSVVSRLWLLTMMVLPALIFLAYRRPPNEKDPAAG